MTIEDAKMLGGASGTNRALGILGFLGLLGVGVLAGIVYTQNKRINILENKLHIIPIITT